MATTLVVQLVLLLLLSVTQASAQEEQQPPRQVVRPGCQDKCGNITIPYPFGIGAGCYRDDGRGGFQLECDDSLPVPWLAVTGYGVQITNLSIGTGEAWAYINVTRHCYNSSGSIISRNGATPVPLINTHLLFSQARNRLVALGCPNLGYFVDTAGYYVSGCMSVCGPSKFTLPGSCTGVACCQSGIPAAVDYFEPYLLDIPKEQTDPIFYSNSTTCRYVFLVEAEWLNTKYTGGSLNRTDDFAVPVVLDWAVWNVRNCKAAKRNATDYACRSMLSHCVNSKNSTGYRCNCSKGYEGNPYLDDGCKDINECERKGKHTCHGACTNTPGSYTCQCPPGTSGDATRKDGCRPKDSFTLALKVVTGVSLGVFLPFFMSFWLYLGLQKRKLIRTKQKFFEVNGGLFLQQQIRNYNGTSKGTGGFEIFSKEELEKATNEFAADQVLGHGGHGIVYKGVLEDKTVVAIKKSKMMEEAPTTEFAREMFILSQINHRNVVKLLGCCLEVEVPMLVYEFVSNGTLYHYIHGSKGLDSDAALDTCLRIAVESAEALAYMHSSASPPILHGDVKTANILLDHKLTAKVSDFGASKLAPTDEAKMATLVQGTCGYLDPEYLMTCRLTDKSDVYSFGVVLLELLTRKKALYFDGPEEDRSLVLCFMMAVKVGQHQDLLDSQVRDEMRIEALEEITHLVVRCLNMSGEERPTMKEVAETLEMLRRYHSHPWAQADANPEEEQSLLAMEPRNANYKFTQDCVLDFEASSTYSYSL
ncbi:wall-associated receptor kinase 1-like [Triticum dicoccoides]|uniref:wall-associated receptor kinase 1-like n=1 Tax=Triticum dicoccoides TaxID=85692 RepID=UPI001890CBED|nr:wall-associated receptor kinase 1-like [Triticum dicoccoides]XP_044406917.1 wall-associated receptor kinase 1-like [Triticum aestivum]